MRLIKLLSAQKWSSTGPCETSQLSFTFFFSHKTLYLQVVGQTVEVGIQTTANLKGQVSLKALMFQADQN